MPLDRSGLSAADLDFDGEYDDDGHMPEGLDPLPEASAPAPPTTEADAPPTAEAAVPPATVPALEIGAPSAAADEAVGALLTELEAAAAFVATHHQEDAETEVIREGLLEQIQTDIDEMGAGACLEEDGPVKALLEQLGDPAGGLSLGRAAMAIEALLRAELAGLDGAPGSAGHLEVLSHSVALREAIELEAHAAKVDPETGEPFGGPRPATIPSSTRGAYREERLPFGDGSNARALAVICAAAKALVNRKGLSELCSRLISAACNADTAGAHIAVLSGAIPALVEGLMLHVAKPRRRSVNRSYARLEGGPLEANLRALAALCAGTASHQVVAKDDACELGALAAVAAGMAEHAREAAVQGAGCCALQSLVVGTGFVRKRLAMEAGVPKALAQAMQGHTESLEVAEAGCRALRSLAHGTDDVATRRKARIAKANGIEAVLGVMKEHADESRLQEQACWALRNICAGPPIHGQRARAIKAGALPLVAAALSAHGERRAGVVEAASWALGTLCAGDDEPSRAHKSAAIKAGAIAALEKGATYHPHDAAVQQMARWAYSTITHGRRTPRPYVKCTTDEFAAHRAKQRAGYPSALRPQSAALRGVPATGARFF